MCFTFSVTVILTRYDKGQMLQVRVQEILTGPQIAHGGSRCICVGTQLVDHLREPEAINFIYYIYINLNMSYLYNEYPFL